MECKKILLVGFGKVGFRYLEGILKTKYRLEIHLLEKDLKRKKIIDNIKTYPEKNIIFHQKSKTLPKSFFLTILSTRADIRVLILKKLSKTIKTKNWILEKPLCQNLKDLNYIQKFFINRKGWVNLNRYSNKYFKKLKKDIYKFKINKMKVSGYNWGIGCNGLHYIQYISKLFQKQKLQFKSLRTDRWYETKRKGIWDIYGVLKMSLEGKLDLILENRFHHKIKKTTILTFYKNKKEKIVLDEKSLFYKKNNLKNKISIPAVSKDITKILIELINKNNCFLPKISDAIEIHKIFVSALLTSWRTIKSKNAIKVPIS